MMYAEQEIFVFSMYGPGEDHVIGMKFPLNEV